jgi:hypothetical protein
MLVSNEAGESESRSAAYNRTYSSASESSVFSPTSSMDSKNLISRESCSELDNQSFSDLGPYSQQRSHNSSTSSDNGHDSPVIPRRDVSGILFTVPEHATGGDFPYGEFIQTPSLYRN